MVSQVPVQMLTNNPQVTKQTIDTIIAQSGAKWRDCRRKSYNISACKLPANYVYANCLEQPESYALIMQQFRKPIVALSAIEKAPEVVKTFLKNHGYYVTSNEKITLCGTQGEMWDVKNEKFLQSYTLADGTPINPKNIVVGKWFVVTRAGMNVTTEVGVQIPNKYFMQVVLDWGTVYMNNPKSKGHHKGDILVFPKGPDGGPDYTKSCSPINNAVFALTFDQNVGGWGRSGNIISAEKAQANQPTIEQLNKITEKLVGGSSLKPVNSIPYEVKNSVANMEPFATDTTMAVVLNTLAESNDNANADNMESLANFKQAVVQSILRNVRKQDTTTYRSITSNFYRDYIGSLNVATRDDLGFWATYLVSHLTGEALTKAMIKFMQTSEVIGTIRSAYFLGVCSINFRIYSLLSEPYTFSVLNDKLYYVTSHKRFSALGCDTSHGKSIAGKYLTAFIIDRSRSIVSLAILPYEENNVPTETDFDKVAVPISSGGESYDSVVNKLAEALTKAKHIWGKYITVSTDIDLLVYRVLWQSIDCFYAHLLTKDTARLLQHKHTYRTNIAHTVEENKSALCDLTIPLTFNHMNVDTADKAHVETNTRLLHVKFDRENATLSFKIQFEGVTFDKTYKLTQKNNVEVIVVRAYMNMCNVLHVHPGKLFFSSSKVWNTFLLPQAMEMLRAEMTTVPILKCKGIKVKDYYIYVNLGIFTADGKQEVGTRVLRAELNYKNFDVKNESNAKVARDLINGCNDDAGIFRSMSIKISFQNLKSRRQDAAEFTIVQDVPFVLAFELKYLLAELIGGTKKYATLANGTTK